MINKILVVLTLAIIGCGHLVKPEESAFSNERRTTPLESYSVLLDKFVNEKGQVNFPALDKNRDELLHYISYIEKKDFESFENSQEKLAHLINAYNALSMYMVLKKEIPSDNEGLFTKMGFFYFPEFQISDRRVSLYELENDYIRKLGDARVHFALNCMSVSCPRLPKEPFIGTKYMN